MEVSRLALIAALLLGCQTPQPTGELSLPTPVLNAPELAGERPSGELTLDGVWSVEIEYAVAQRAAGMPDLDLYIHGTGTASGANGALTLDGLKMDSIPDSDTLQSHLKAQLEALVSGLPTQPRTSTEHGFQLGPNTSVVTRAGRAETIWMVDERSGTNKHAWRQKSRLALMMKRLQ